MNNISLDNATDTVFIHVDAIAPAHTLAAAGVGGAVGGGGGGSSTGAGTTGEAQPLPNPGAPGGTGAPAGGPLNFLLPIMLGFFGLIIVMQIMGGRKEKKMREQMLSSLSKHDRVQTSGGMIGTIVELKDDQVTLKVDESNNTRITFLRSAVTGILKSDPTKAA